MKFGRSIPHDVQITGSANLGYVVTVGCATFVFTDPQELLSALANYLENPGRMMKEYARKVTGSLVSETHGAGQVEEAAPEHPGEALPERQRL